VSMPQSQHYCAECDTHFGGPPNNISPEQHADIAHDGGLFVGVVDGSYKDWTGDMFSSER